MSTRYHRTGRAKRTRVVGRARDGRKNKIFFNRPKFSVKGGVNSDRASERVPDALANTPTMAFDVADSHARTISDSVAPATGSIRPTTASEFALRICF